MFLRKYALTVIKSTKLVILFLNTTTLLLATVTFIGGNPYPPLHKEICVCGIWKKCELKAA